MQELLEVVGSNPAQGIFFFLYFQLNKKQGLQSPLVLIFTVHRGITYLTIHFKTLGNQTQ